MRAPDPSDICGGGCSWNQGGKKGVPSSGKTHTECEEKRTEGETEKPLFREKAKGHQKSVAREAGKVRREKGLGVHARKHKRSG